MTGRTAGMVVVLLGWIALVGWFMNRVMPW